MANTRTQVYFQEEQRRRIDALAQARGVTMTEIVRRAVDSYLDNQAPTPEETLTLHLAPCPTPPYLIGTNGTVAERLSREKRP